MRNPLRSEWDGGAISAHFATNPADDQSHPFCPTPLRDSDPQTDRVADQSGVEEARNSPLVPSIYNISHRLIN